MSGKGTSAETERVGDRTVRVVLFPVNLITSWSGLRENPRLRCRVNNHRVQSIESDREAIYRLNNTALNLVRLNIIVKICTTGNAYVQYREYLRKSQIMPMKLIEPLKQIFIVHFKRRGWTKTTIYANP